MTFQDVDANSAWAVIENSSLALDLAVSFQSNAPATVAQGFSGNPWQGVVQSGGAKRFLLPPNNGLWTGRIWLYPLNVSSQSAATGGSSGYSRAYVTTFGAGEEPVDFQGVIRGLDLTSQPRIISVPMAAGSTIYKTLTLPTTVLAFNAGNVVNAAMLTVGASQGLTQAVSVYLHNASAYALTVGACQFSISAWYCDAANVPLQVVGGQFFFEAWAAGEFGPKGGTSLAFATPELRTSQSVPANTASIQLFYILTGGGGGMTVSVRFDCSVDVFNAGFIGGVGSHTNFAGDLY